MAKFDFSKDGITPSIENIDSIRNDLISKVDYTTEVNIKSGFIHPINDKKYRFSYNADDQRNFTQQSVQAAISMMLGTKTREELQKEYGVDDDNEPRYNTMPAPLPDKFVALWQAHHLEDDGVTGVQLNIKEFLELAVAGGTHLNNLLLYGQSIKMKLRACTNKAQLDAVEDMYKINERYQDAIAKKK